MNPHDVYAIAAQETGKSEGFLRQMAESVFASMLHHAMQRPTETIWSAIVMDPFSVEVDIARRRRPPLKDAFAAIRESGGSAWDKIDDPDNFIRWLRGDSDALATAAAEQAERVIATHNPPGGA